MYGAVLTGVFAGAASRCTTAATNDGDDAPLGVALALALGAEGSTEAAATAADAEADADAEDADADDAMLAATAAALTDGAGAAAADEDCVSGTVAALTDGAGAAADEEDCPTATSAALADCAGADEDDDNAAGTAAALTDCAGADEDDAADGALALLADAGGAGTLAPSTSSTLSSAALWFATGAALALDGAPAPLADALVGAMASADIAPLAEALGGATAAADTTPLGDALGDALLCAWAGAALLPSTSAVFALGVIGTKMSVTFCGARGAASSRVPSAVEVACAPGALSVAAADVELPEAEAEVAAAATAATSCAVVVSIVPSSSPAYHMGRSTPDVLLYANVWLMCVVSTASALAPLLMHFCPVITCAVLPGLGSKVRQ